MLKSNQRFDEISRDYENSNTSGLENCFVILQKRLNKLNAVKQELLDRSHYRKKGGYKFYKPKTSPNPPNRDWLVWPALLGMYLGSRRTT